MQDPLVFACLYEPIRVWKHLHVYIPCGSIRPFPSNVMQLLINLVLMHIILVILFVFTILYCLQVLNCYEICDVFYDFVLTNVIFELLLYRVSIPD